MPKGKKVSIDERRDWLRRFEIGQTIEQISKAAGRDTRTVKRFLVQARKEADLHIARQSLLMKALDKHNDAMLSVVRNIIQALEVPGAQLELRRDERDQWLDVPLTVSKGVQTPNGTKVILHGEDSVIWRLLAEHLGTDSPMDRIFNWKRAKGAYLDTSKAFKISILDTMKMRTELGVIEEPRDKPTKPILFTATEDILFPVFIHRMMVIRDGTDPEHNVQRNSEGYLSLHGTGTHLAWLSQEGSPTEDHIKQALHDLEQSREFEQWKESYLNLIQIANKLRDEFEEIELLGYIAGRCRVCERLER